MPGSTFKVDHHDGGARERQVHARLVLPAGRRPTSRRRRPSPIQNYGGSTCGGDLRRGVPPQLQHRRSPRWRVERRRAGHGGHGRARAASTTTPPIDLPRPAQVSCFGDRRRLRRTTSRCWPSPASARATTQVDAAADGHGRRRRRQRRRDDEAVRRRQDRSTSDGHVLTQTTPSAVADGDGSPQTAATLTRPDGRASSTTARPSAACSWPTASRRRPRPAPRSSTPRASRRAQRTPGSSPSPRPRQPRYAVAVMVKAHARGDGRHRRDASPARSPRQVLDDALALPDGRMTGRRRDRRASDGDPAAGAARH